MTRTLFKMVMATRPGGGRVLFAEVHPGSIDAEIVKRHSLTEVGPDFEASLREAMLRSATAVAACEDCAEAWKRRERNAPLEVLDEPDPGAPTGRS